MLENQILGTSSSDWCVTGQRECRLSLTSVRNLAAAGVDGLEQLVDLVVAHLLAQIRQDVAQLPDADEARPVLVKHLEAAAVLVNVARVAEAAGAVEDLAESVEVDCRARFVLVWQFLSAWARPAVVEDEVG